jgi:hypothetical protein
MSAAATAETEVMPQAKVKSRSRQARANRRNSKKSTGPGKRRGSAQSARSSVRPLPVAFLRLAAKKRPNNRPCLSFSIRACQLAAVLPSRSSIPARSAEIAALPLRNSRAVESTQ